MGWQTQQLAATDGVFTVQLGSLLHGAVVPYQHYLQQSASGTQPMSAKALRARCRGC